MALNVNFDDRRTSVFSILSEASSIYGNTHNGNNNFIAAENHLSKLERQHQRIEISRRTVDLHDLNKNRSKYEKEKLTLYHVKHKIVRVSTDYFKKRTLYSWLSSLIPILSWIRGYSFKNDFINDFITGFTLSVIHIPQGMANGMLAGLGPINGLYVSFFPVIIYSLLGTGRHTSIGTFSLMSVMSNDALSSVLSEDTDESNSYSDSNNGTLSDQEYTPLEVLTSVCLLSGILQLLMGCLHMGILSVLLSENLVSAFATAAAIHVTVLEIPLLLDIKLAKIQHKYFKIIYEIIAIFEEIQHTNLISLAISFISILVLVVFKEYLEPKIKQKYPFIKLPIPIDLILVISITLITWVSKLDETQNVTIIGEIPVGLPAPQFPRLDIFPLILTDSIVIAIVGFAITQSMGQTFAKKHKYKIDANQELVAIGTANVFSSCFLCYPCSPSLARSSVCSRLGGKTTLSSLVSSFILLFVLLFLEPLLYYLPQCILACIIVVALKSMFLQVKDFKKAFKISKSEALSWLVTFMAVLLFDVAIGLLIGVAFALFLILLRLMLPRATILGQLAHSELYLNVKNYNYAIQFQGVKIFHFSCALLFINCHSFKETLYNKVFNISSNDIHSIDSHDSIDTLAKDEALRTSSQRVHTIIIDCSSIFYIDNNGMETLIEVISELNTINITVMLASCNDTIISTLEKGCFFDKIAKTNIVCASVHDAVITALSSTDMSSV